MQFRASDQFRQVHRHYPRHNQRSGFLLPFLTGVVLTAPFWLGGGFGRPFPYPLPTPYPHPYPVPLPQPQPFPPFGPQPQPFPPFSNPNYMFQYQFQQMPTNF